MKLKRGASSIAAFETETVTCRTLTELADVSAIGAEWEALLERSVCNRAFSSPQWFAAACRHNPLVRPHLIIARRGAQLAGIFPLAFAEAERTLSFPTRLADYNDMITAADDGDAPAALLRHALARNSYRLSLSNVRSDSNCARALQSISLGREVEQTFQPGLVCPYVRLPSSYREYLLTRSSALRKSLRSARSRAQRMNVSARELEPENYSAEEVSKVFLRLQLTRRQGLRNAFVAEAAQSFAAEVIGELFPRRSLRAFALLAAEKIVAIDLCVVGANSLCVWNGGFLPEFASISPGKLLMETAIKRAIELQLKEYDLLRGDEDYKVSWANSSRRVGRLEFNING